MNNAAEEMTMISLCAFCQNSGVETPAESTVYLHRAFGSAACAEVPVCEFCLEAGAHDEHDPDCQSCDRDQEG